MPRLTLRKSSDFSARFHADPPKVATMLPQCSHITRKRGVFYYRRRLPKPLTGELALSLRTRAFREAEWLARVLDAAFPRMLRRMNDAKNLADINRIAREYLRDELDFDMKLRAKASQTPVYGYLYFNEDASQPDRVAADLLMDRSRTRNRREETGQPPLRRAPGHRSTGSWMSTRYPRINGTIWHSRSFARA